MKISTILFVIAVCILSFGCGSKELTRSKAKSIIENSDYYKQNQHQVWITRDEAIALVNAKYLMWQGFGVFHLVLAPSGQKYFANAGGEVMTAFNPYTAPLFVVPIKDMRPKVVEVTGITGNAPESKVVEYTWTWDSSGQPQELKQMVPSFTAIKPDKAQFTLYDDGWRVSWPVVAKN